MYELDDGCMNRYMNGTNECINGFMNGCMNGFMNGCKNGTNGCTV